MRYKLTISQEIKRKTNCDINNCTDSDSVIDEDETNDISEEFLGNNRVGITETKNYTIQIISNETCTQMSESDRLP